MTCIRSVALVCVLGGALFASAQPTLSSLQGRVVRWGTNDPVAKVTVELRRVEAGDPAPYVATTNSDGAFVFASVVPGQYRLVATRPGFVPAEYGQRWPSGSGTPLTIPSGQAVSNVPVPMLQTGTISGSVRDQSGRPIGNAEVSALKATYQNGRRELTKVQSVSTDERGEYRLFWLTPGRYFVAARHPDVGVSVMRMGGTRMAGGGAVGPNGPIGFQQFRVNGDNAASSPVAGIGPTPAPMTEKYVDVYYPNTTDEIDAASLEVTAGAEVQSIDFAIAPQPLHRVRGHVVYESNNEPAMSAKVQWITSSGVSPPPDLGFGIGATLTQVQCCDGAFELSLTSGTYTLVAAVNSLSTRVSVSVSVGDGDVDGIVIALGRGFDIKGRLAFEGRAATPQELSAFRISLALEPPVSGLVPDGYSNILPNGSFTLHAGRGDFQIGVAPLLMASGAFRFPTMNASPSLKGNYVKSIRLGDVDVLNRPLHLDGPVSDSFDIVIGTVVGSVNGVVVDQDRKPLPNVTVALVPDGERRARVDLKKSTSSDLSGRFAFAAVPPGDYIAFAIDGPDDGEWQNPDVVASARVRGVAVRVGDAPASVELVARPPQ
jgi:hypothetical protein